MAFVIILLGWVLVIAGLEIYWAFGGPAPDLFPYFRPMLGFVLLAAISGLASWILEGITDALEAPTVNASDHPPVKIADFNWQRSGPAHKR